MCPCETLVQIDRDSKLFSTVLYLEEKDLLKEEKTTPCVGTGEMRMDFPPWLVMAGCCLFWILKGR